MKPSQDNQIIGNKDSLQDRLQRLPHFFFLEMREGFYAMKSNSTWSRFMNGKQSLKVAELQYLAKTIGCSLDDLLNPDFDLLHHFKEKENDDLAAEFGLVRPEA